jgi:hypothetical protein
MRACVIARDYRADLTGSPVSSPVERPLNTTLDDMRACRIGRYDAWVDWTGGFLGVAITKAYLNHKAVSCLAERGLRVALVARSTDSFSGTFDSMVPLSSARTALPLRLPWRFGFGACPTCYDPARLSLGWLWQGWGVRFRSGGVGGGVVSSGQNFLVLSVTNVVDGVPPASVKFGDGRLGHARWDLEIGKQEGPQGVLALDEMSTGTARDKHQPVAIPSSEDVNASRHSRTSRSYVDLPFVKRVKTSMTPRGHRRIPSRAP